MHTIEDKTYYGELFLFQSALNPVDWQGRGHGSSVSLLGKEHLVKDFSVPNKICKRLLQILFSNISVDL